MMDQRILTKLNQPGKETRLLALKAVAASSKLPPSDPRYINNHIHTTYSFSPYSPAAAVYFARAAGLCTAGIIDHDSIGGAKEFLEAGDILGMPTTIGMECRVSMAGTPLARRTTNNPDQPGVSYMTMHAVPHENIDMLQSAFAPLREKRNARNRAMTEKIDAMLAPRGIRLDFDLDVLPLSQYASGGSVTERHLMYALAHKIVEAAGRGEGAVALLNKLGVALSEKQKKLLLDTVYPFYEYDLLGILKSAFVPLVYIPATDECLSLNEAVKLASDVGAVFCYAYLGDVADSVTGDKKAQKFEDGYLDELFGVLKDYNVRAVTYMPPRNTRAQLDRLRALCKSYGMFEISGEDINSPRQDFVCKAMEDPQFSNLIDATWALIAHERGEKKLL
ncbi:MAG TPA: PHP domain-containing protein [Feifaniaceae bacterium]|nr:PHP domain-containing protein [Feifaniaceae bacterium]